jgi:uncharacterized protein YlxP (DUF503 family)
MRSKLYFAVMKITFMVEEDNPDQTSPAVKRDLQALVEKLRARFRVAILPGQVEDSGDAPVLAVASLAHSEEALSRQLDSICEFCESSGFGRIDTERTLLDHIDSFGSDEEDYEEDPDDDPDDDNDDDDPDDDDSGSDPFDRSH